MRPICLPHQGDDFLKNEGSDVTLTGFGYANDTYVPDKLQRGDLEIMDHTECIANYRNTNAAIKGSQMCARGRSNSATNSCKGDSGSGLVTHNTATGRETLVGVVSYGGSRCGGANRPSVYTNVIEHVDWINSIINKGLIFIMFNKKIII